MALLFVESFDHYNTTAKLDQKWTSHFSGVTDTFVTGRFGYGQALRHNSASPSEFKWLSGQYATIIMGGCFRVSDVHGGGVIQGGATVRGVSLMHTYAGHLSPESNGNIQNGFGIDGEGRVNVFSGVYGAILGNSPPLIRNNQWNYIELKITTHASAGAFTLRVNGVVVASGSGLNTVQGANPNYIDTIGMGAGGIGNVDYDDIYVCDTSGSVNNDFLGEIDVRTQFPSSDNSVQFTRNTGATNAAAVADNPPDDATSYVEDSTTGHKDFYGMASLTAGGGASANSIKAVSVISRVAKTDSANRTCRANLKSSATTANGATITPRIDYDWQQDIFERDPNGSIAWTEAAVNAALPGIEIVS